MDGRRPCSRPSPAGSSVGDSLAARVDRADDRRAPDPPSCTSLRTAGASSAPTTRIRPMPMLKVRSMSVSGTSPARCSQANSGGTRHAERSTVAWLPAGSTRGRFSVMPPPVMWAIPLIAPDASSGRTVARYERCGVSSASPIVRSASHGTPDLTSGRPVRTRSAGPTSSRWCGVPTKGCRSARLRRRSACRRSTDPAPRCRR